MTGRMILLFSVTVGIGMNVFGEVGESMSAEDLLARYSEAVSRMHRLSVHIHTRRTPEPGLNPSWFDIETDLNIHRNGEMIDYFGTERIFDSNAVCVKYGVECHLFKDGKYYVAVKWPVDGKPDKGYVSSDIYTERLCILLNAAEYGGLLWGRVDGCGCKDIRELLSESGK